MFRTRGPKRPIIIALPLVVLSALAAALLLRADAPALAQGGPPGNDSWNTRSYIYPGWDGVNYIFPMRVDQPTDGATVEPDERRPCGDIGATVWFEYYADRNGTLVIDAAGTSFDAVIAAYTWDFSSGQLLPSPPDGNLLELGCEAGTAADPPRLSVPISSGQSIFIQAGGVGGATGMLRFVADCEPACAPPNDDFMFAHGLYVDPYTPEAHVVTTTEAATMQPSEPQPCGDIGATVWYSMYGDLQKELVLDATASDFDAVIAVYTSNEYRDTPTGLTLLACNDAPGGGRIELELDPGVSYWVQAGGRGGATGTLDMTLRCDPSCPPYADNIGYSGYYDVPVSFGERTNGATLEDGEPRPCGDIGKTVWYQVIARGDTRIVIDTAGSDIDPVVAVYEAVSFSPPPASFELMECAAGTRADPPRVEFDAKGMQLYWVQAGGVDAQGGLINLDIRCDGACPPYQDNHLNPWYLWIPGGFPFEDNQDVSGATTQPGEQTSCGNMGATVWYMLSANGSDTPMEFTTNNSGFDTAIAVYEAPYEGAPIDQLTQIACSAGGDGERASIRFNAQPDQPMYVQVGGRNGARGQLNVQGNCVGFCPPENDDIARAWWSGPWHSIYSDTRGATLEDGESQPCGNIGKTVWYSLQPGGATDMTIFTEGSDFATVIAVYEMEGLSPPGGMREIACTTSGSLDLATRGDRAYMVQIGGVDGASGILQAQFACNANCPSQVIPVDTGGRGGGGGFLPIPGASGTVRLPDTGNGGYLPGARE